MSTPTKKHWLVIQICENGKYYCHAWPVAESDNLISTIARFGENVISVNIAPTKKRAAEIVHAWRAAYIENGTNLYEGVF